jgi:predicted metal-dependent phosphoesterase TrpH
MIDPPEIIDSQMGFIPRPLCGLVDLHTHSSASDGSFSPAELIAEAARQGLCALALTDHDTISGLEEAGKAARKTGLRFIPGIELQIKWNHDSGENSGEFHLLGLGLYSPSPGFLETVADLAQRRENRNLEILERMHELSIDISYDEVKTLGGGHSIGRPHFAALLVKRRIVRNIEQAFSLYLGRGKALYVPKAGLEFERAVSIIKESGGMAVLAHPMSLYVSWGRLPDLIKDLKDKGLDGIEAWHPTAKVGSCKRLEELGKSLNLVITAGSDFHGARRPDRKLGITAGGRKIDASFLEAIEAETAK